MHKNLASGADLQCSVAWHDDMQLKSIANHCHAVMSVPVHAKALKFQMYDTCCCDNCSSGKP